jgi:hypothetical protein
MSGPTRTNHAYAHLAYRAAIIDVIVEHLMEHYVGNEATTPEMEIECTQLVREDSTVPVDELLNFVDDLKGKKAVIDHELSKFSFVRRSDEQGLGLKPGHRALYSHGFIERPTPQSQGTAIAGEPSKRRRRKRGGRHR